MGIHDQRLQDTIALAKSKPGQLLIDGQWVNALSGETFTTATPATGQVIREVAKGGPDDIDLAVAAARRALEEGPWSKFSPFERQAVPPSLWGLGGSSPPRVPEVVRVRGR